MGSGPSRGGGGDARVHAAPVDGGQQQRAAPPRPSSAGARGSQSAGVRAGLHGPRFVLSDDAAAAAAAIATSVAGRAAHPLAAVLTPLHSIYELAHAARTRPAWIDSFVSFLNALEDETIDVVRRDERQAAQEQANGRGRSGSQNPSDSDADVIALVECLEECADVLRIVLARPPFLSAILDARDQADLRRTRLDLNTLKQRALYGREQAAAPDVIIRPTDAAADAVAVADATFPVPSADAVSPPASAGADVRIRIPPSPTGAPARPVALHSDNGAPAATATAVSAAASSSSSPDHDASLVRALAEQQPLTSFKLQRGDELVVSALALVAQRVPALAALVDPLKDLYALWSGASNRTQWLADFFAALHSLEIQLAHAVAATAAAASAAATNDVFTRESALLQPAFWTQAAAVLSAMVPQVREVSCRGRFLGAAFAVQDRVTLEDLRDNLADLQRMGMQLLSQAEPGARSNPAAVTAAAAISAAHRRLQSSIDAQQVDSAHARASIARRAQEDDALRALLSPIDHAGEIVAERERYCVGTRAAVIEQVQRWAEPTSAAAFARRQRRDKQGESAPSGASASASSSGPPTAAAAVSPPSRVFTLLGLGGVGKSCLSSVLLECFPSFFVAAHLCRHDLEARRSPARLIRNVAFQLCARLPDYRAALLRRLYTLQAAVPVASAAELWDLLLVQPCADMQTEMSAAHLAAAAAATKGKGAGAASMTGSSVAPVTDGVVPASATALFSGHQRVCILIDALDECGDGRVGGGGGGGGGGSNSLVQLLSTQAEQLPPWLCFLVTSRPDRSIVPSLNRVASPPARAFLSYDDDENRRDVEIFLRSACVAAGGLELSARTHPNSTGLNGQQQQLLRLDPRELESAVQMLLSKSKGMFLYARLMIQQLAATQRQLDDEAASASSSSSSSSSPPALASQHRPSVLSLAQHVEALPSGLDRFYLAHMRRVRAFISEPGFARRVREWRARPGASGLTARGDGGARAGGSPAAGPSSSDSEEMNFVLAVLQLVVCSFERLSLASLALILGSADEASLRTLLGPLCHNGLFRLEEQEDVVPAAALVRLERPASASASAPAPAPAPSVASGHISFACLVPFHKSAVDWLTSAARLSSDAEADERNCFVSVRAGHERMREACWMELRRGAEEEKEEEKEQVAKGEGQAPAPVAVVDGPAAPTAPSSASAPEVQWPRAPLLCVDRAADPDIFLPASSFLSYALRFGPKHCLSAAQCARAEIASLPGSTPSNAAATLALATSGATSAGASDATGTATASGVAPQSPCTASFLTRFPFLAAAQFLAHLQYLHMRAAINDLAGLALEYAACEDYAEEWEREQTAAAAAVAAAAMATAATATTSRPMIGASVLASPLRPSPLTGPLNRLAPLSRPPPSPPQPGFGVSAPATLPPASSPGADANMGADAGASATPSPSLVASDSALARWLWLRSPLQAIQSLRDFRFLVQLDMSEWRGVGGGGGGAGGAQSQNQNQHVWDVRAAHERADEAAERKRNERRVRLQRRSTVAHSSSSLPSAATAASQNSYLASLRHWSLFRCPSVASQFLYSSALSFPRTSAVWLVGARRFDEWFCSWAHRQVHRVEWVNRPRALPDLLATLRHQYAAAAAPAAAATGPGSDAGPGAGAGTTGGAVGSTVSASSASSLKIHALCCSPDGTLIASLCALDRSVRLFHSVSFELLHVIPTGLGASATRAGASISGSSSSRTTPSTLVWTADSALLGVGGYRAPLQLYHARASGGEKYGSAMGSPLRGVESCVFIGQPAATNAATTMGGASSGESLDSSIHPPRESFAIVAGYSTSLELYSLSSSTLLHSFGEGVHQSRSNLLRLNSDHSLLASAGWDEYVVVWGMGSVIARERAARAAEGLLLLDDAGREEAVRSWVKSIRPLAVLVPPLSAGYHRRAAQVASLPLSVRGLAWHPMRPGTLVSASTDCDGNGLCMWEVGAQGAGAGAEGLDDDDAATIANPSCTIVQTAEQCGDEMSLVAFTPSGSHLLVAAAGRTALSVFRALDAGAGTGAGSRALHSRKGAYAGGGSQNGPAALELEYVGVVDVADVGDSITCMEFAGARQHQQPQAQRNPATASTGATAAVVPLQPQRPLRPSSALLAWSKPAEPTPSSSSSSAHGSDTIDGDDDLATSLRRVFLLTGDTAGHARVWNTGALLSKAHQPLEPMRKSTARLSELGSGSSPAVQEDTPVEPANSMRPLGSEEETKEEKEEQREEGGDEPVPPPSSSSVAGFFPHIDLLACNERFLVVADKESNLHTYRTGDGCLVRTMPWDTPSASSASAVAGGGASASAPPGRVVHMVLGSRQSNTSPSMLIVSYASFRGLKQWDVARGILLRIIGSGVLNPATPCMAFQPRAGPLAPQLLAPDANMLGLWALQPPAPAAAAAAEKAASSSPGDVLARSVLRLPPRARDPALAPGRSVAAKAQHFGAVARVAFHPRGSCAASCESNGVVKLWHPKHTDQFDQASAPPLLWTDEATVAWTHVLSSRDGGSAGGDNGGGGDSSDGFIDDPLSAPVHLTCLSFAPSPRALLAAGGSNHGVTLLDVVSSSAMALTLWRTPGKGDCAALCWSECARFLVTVDRRHTVTVWSMPPRFLDAFAGAGSVDTDADAGRSPPMPLLHAHYFNQSLSSGLAPLSSSSYVLVSFVNAGRHLLFHHAQENCVKVWRTEWAERERQTTEGAAAGATAASSSPLVPLSTPVLFHCDRLTSSSQNSIIHFFTTR